MMLVAVIGLLPLALRDPRYVLASAPVLVAGWYVNSVVFDWYQVRRFTGVVPLLAPGLAVALAPLMRAGVAVCALVAFLVLRYDVAVDALRSTPGDPAPLRAVVAQTADGLAASGYELVARASPRTATRLLGVYTGQPLLEDGVTTVDLAGEASLLRLPLPARHLSAPAVEVGRAFPANAGQRQHCVDVYVLRKVRDAFASCSIEQRVRPVQPHEIYAEGFNIRDALPRGRRLGDLDRDLVHPGTNILILRFDRGPIYHRVRGEGPREIRPAAISTLTLRRD